MAASSIQFEVVNWNRVLMAVPVEGDTTSIPLRGGAFISTVTVEGGSGSTRVNMLNWKVMVKPPIKLFSRSARANKFTELVRAVAFYLEQ